MGVPGLPQSLGSDWRLSHQDWGSVGLCGASWGSAGITGNIWGPVPICGGPPVARAATAAGWAY